MATTKNKIKEAKNALEDLALVAGTYQNLSNLYSLDIYGHASSVSLPPGDLILPSLPAP
jgi:hypothetical protein